MTTTPAPSIAASPLTGTSTGPFPTGFKYATSADVRVYLELAGERQPDLTAGSDYTLTGATPLVDGGTVTLSGAIVPDGGWASGDRVVIRRRTVKSQALALPNSEGHKPKATEAALDKQMRALEEQDDHLALALTVPAGETGMTLPPAGVRAGRLFVGGASGAALTMLEGAEEVVVLNAAGQAVTMPLTALFAEIGTTMIDDGDWAASDNPASNDDGVWG